jgi:hypothetical protein
MSEEILSPPDELCECGLPYGDAVHTGDADVEDEARERAEFEQAVAKRTEELVAEKKYFAALVSWKMAQARGDSSVPHPGGPSLDKLELARIRADETVREVQRRVAQKMQAARGDKAEFIRPAGWDATAADRRAWLNGGAKEVLSMETRDAGVVETRDA